MAVVAAVNPFGISGRPCRNRLSDCASCPWSVAGSQGVRLRFFNGDVLVQQGLRGGELRRLKGFLGRNPSLLFICESEYQFLITALVAQAPIAIKRGQTTFSSLPASKQSWATAPG